VRGWRAGVWAGPAGRQRRERQPLQKPEFPRLYRCLFHHHAIRGRVVPNFAFQHQQAGVWPPVRGGSSLVVGSCMLPMGWGFACSSAGWCSSRLLEGLGNGRDGFKKAGPCWRRSETQGRALTGIRPKFRKLATGVARPEARAAKTLSLAGLAGGRRAGAQGRRMGNRNQPYSVGSSRPVGAFFWARQWVAGFP